MWVPVVAVGSRYTSAKVSIVKLVLPALAAAAKSTTGTTTRQGSPVGILVGFDPVQGSVIAGHPANLALKPWLIGPTLLPGFVYTVQLPGPEHVPSELIALYGVVAPFARSVFRPLPPLPSRSNHPQLPGKSILPR